MSKFELDDLVTFTENVDTYSTARAMSAASYDYVAKVVGISPSGKFLDLKLGYISDHGFLSLSTVRRCIRKKDGEYYIQHGKSTALRKL